MAVLQKLTKNEDLFLLDVSVQLYHKLVYIKSSHEQFNVLLICM